MKVQFDDIKLKIQKNALFVDSFWAVVGNVSAKGLTLVSGILVARFLGSEVYGQFGIIRNTLFSIAIFSTLGLGYTGTKFVAEYIKLKSTTVWLIINYITKITLITSGVIATGVFIGSDYIAIKMLNDPKLSFLLKLTSFIIIFNALTTSQTGILSGFGIFKKIAKINSIVGIISCILSLVFTYFWNLYGALTALFLSQIINFIFNRDMVLKAVREFPKEKIIKAPKLLKEILNFSIPVAMQEMVYSASSWLGSLMLVKFSNYTQLGLYSAALQWNTIILFIPGILRNVVLSHLTKSTENRLEYNKIMNNTLIFNFIATFIPFLIVFIFSEKVELLYGISFKGLGKIMSISLLSTIFSSLSNAYSQAYMSKGKSWLMLGIRAIRDVGIVSIGYILLQGANETGAVSLVTAGLIMNIIFLIGMFLVYKFKIENS